MISSLLNRKQETLGKASIVLAALTFTGQLLSVIRDRLLAGEFGAGTELDIYYTAFRVPDILFVLLASFFSVYVITPMIADRFKDGMEYGNKEVFAFLNRLATLFSVLILAFCTILFFIYPFIADTFFSDFTGKERELLIFMSRVLLLSPIFLGLSNIFSSFNQYNKKFYSFAIAPVLYNISILFGIVFLVPFFGVIGLVYGVVIGLVLHAFLAYIPARTDGFVFRPNFGFNFSEIKEIFTVSVPRTAGLVSKQFVLFFITAFAVNLGEGKVTLFTFSFMIYMVTLSLIGSTVSVASFAESSRTFSSGDLKGYVEKVAKSFRYLSFWALPITVLFLLFNNEIVKIVLGTGKFDEASQYMVSAGIFIFAFSILFQSLSLFLSTSYFAAKKTLKPFLINFFCDVLIILSAFFSKVHYMENEAFRSSVNDIFLTSGTNGAVLLMITAFSVGSILNGVLLFLFFGKDNKGFFAKALDGYHKKLLPSILIFLIGYLVLNFFKDIFPDDLGGILGYSLVSGFVILFIFILILEKFKGREYLVIRENFYRKISRLVNK